MMFKKSAQERVPLNLNQLIRNVLKRNQGEAQLGQVSVKAELDEQLPLTTGTPTQPQQVVSHLIAHAIAAMSSVTDRPRVLRVKYDGHASGSVIGSVGVSGSGVETENKERSVEQFF